MAIKLSEHFTYKKLLRFTLPTIVMMIFMSLYSIVDGIFVSNFAGSDPFTALNLVFPVVVIFSTVGFMVGTGGSALVSKTLGEAKKEKARQYFSMLIYFDIVMGLLLSVLGILTIRPITQFLGAKDQILDYGVAYGRILFCGLPAYILQNSFQSLMVAAERPKLGLIISILAGILNMLLDFLLIYWWGMGIKGAGIATALSQCVGGLVPLAYFMSDNSTPYRLIRTGFEVKPIAKACLNGLSEMMMNLSASVVNILYNFQLLRITGNDGVIAYGIIMYVSYIFISTFLGFSIGSAPIVSFHFGAQNVDELQNLFRRSLLIIFGGSFFLTGISEMTSPFLAKIFVGYDPELYQMTLRAIRIYFLSFLIMGYNTYTSAFFTGLNNGIVSALISVSRTLIFEVSMIYILPIFLGLDGIWLAVTVAEILSLGVSVVLLLQNRKKYHYF